MTKQVCLRRLMNFFNAIGVLNEDSFDTVRDKHALQNEFNVFPHQGHENDIENHCFPSGIKSISRLNSGNSANRSRCRHHSPDDNGFYNLSALKLDKLKALILDQANELKKQKFSLDENAKEIDSLRSENESLRKALLQLSKNKVTSANTSTTSSPKRDYSRKRRKCSSENGNFNRNESRGQLEIINLSPTSSKIRRVKSDSVTINRKSSVNKRLQIDSDTQCTVFEIQSPNDGIDHKDISIPTWRIFPFTPSVTLEKTEDITDDSYSKRHQKFYMDEKRQIRRDRMRERQLEVYRKRSSGVSYLNNKNHARDKAEEIEAIIIADKVQKNGGLPPFNIPQLSKELNLSTGTAAEQLTAESKRKRRRLS